MVFENLSNYCMMPEYWTMKYSALLYTFFELLTFQSTPTISDLGAKLGIVKGRFVPANPR